MKEFTSGTYLAERIFFETKELFKIKEIDVVNIDFLGQLYIDFKILFKDKYYLNKRINYSRDDFATPTWFEYENAREKIYEIMSYISIMGYDFDKYQKEKIKEFFKNPKQIEDEKNYINERILVNTIIENIKEKKWSKTYIMKDNHSNLYKIGRSIDPIKREKTLQSEKPSIKLIKTFDKNIENELHIKYNDFRVRGEWFNLNNIQVKYICTHY